MENIIDYSKINIPERWRNVNIASVSDTEIEELIEEFGKSGITVNLGLPFLPETVALFFGEFHCRRCGDCCLGAGAGREEGIALAPEDTEKLSQFMLLSKRKFKDQLTFVKDGQRRLRYPCIFYNSHSCTIYSIRPGVCRLYPLNNPIKPTNLNPIVDGIYLMAADSRCAEARRVAVKFIKMQRQALAFNAKLDNNTRSQIKQASESFWHQAKQSQLQGR